MGFVESVGDAIKAALCTNLRLGDNANEFFNELSPIDLPNFSKYWRPKLCDDDPAQVIPPAPPFLGGQCVGVAYRVVVRTNTALGSTSNSTGRNVIGPISGAFARDIPGGSELVVSANPDKAIAISSAPASQVFLNPTIIQITREDNQPDTCGNPDPIIPPWPPGGKTFNISPTYIDNEGDTVNLSGNFTLFAPIGIFAPFVRVFAPVTVDLGGITFNGTLELAPEFNFNFGTPPGFTGPGRPTGTAPDEDPSTSPDTPEDEGDMKLIGIVVRSQPSAGTQTTELDETNAPDLFVPRLANAYFRTRNGTVLGWFGPIDIKTTSAFVPVPPNVNAVDARVSYQKGWSGSFIKILGQKQTIS